MWGIVVGKFPIFSNFFGATPYKELKTRIDKYLKENKKEKIIEPEKLMSSLRTSYPEGF